MLSDRQAKRIKLLKRILLQFSHNIVLHNLTGKPTILY